MHFSRFIGRHYLYQYGIFGKSYKGHMVDALALIGDEGRGYLRKASDRR